jgi:hypothetical protein
VLSLSLLLRPHTLAQCATIPPFHHPPGINGSRKAPTIYNRHHPPDINGSQPRCHHSYPPSPTDINGSQPRRRASAVVSSFSFVSASAAVAAVLGGARPARGRFCDEPQVFASGRLNATTRVMPFNLWVPPRCSATQPDDSQPMIPNLMKAPPAHMSTQPSSPPSPLRRVVSFSTVAAAHACPMRHHPSLPSPARHQWVPQATAPPFLPAITRPTSMGPSHFATIPTRHHPPGINGSQPRRRASAVVSSFSFVSAFVAVAAVLGRAMIPNR